MKVTSRPAAAKSAAMDAPWAPVPRNAMRGPFCVFHPITSSHLLCQSCHSLRSGSRCCGFLHQHEEILLAEAARGRVLVDASNHAAQGKVELRAARRLKEEIDVLHQDIERGRGRVVAVDNHILLVADERRGDGTLCDHLEHHFVAETTLEPKGQ